MEAKIKSIVEVALNEIETATTLKEVEEIKVKYLGKSGAITEFNKMMKTLSQDDKPKIGQVLNIARNSLDDAIKVKGERLYNEELEKKLAQNKVDITLPVSGKMGALHPLSIMSEKLIQFFSSRGYIVFDGPEIDVYENNFDKLNIPKDHPARDVQDTFYVDDEYLLRSHTSNLQVRMLQQYKPPFKMVGIGRAYRGDEVDATHSPVFEQMEVMVVDKNVSMADLKTTISELAKFLFGEHTDVRLRPSFFPFTEPSVEADVTCVKCKGKGCSVCKNTGWMEIFGCGMINPNVLEAGGVDSTEYSGFALGAGVERLTMCEFGISDMRALYENDIRFLKQFK